MISRFPRNPTAFGGSLLKGHPRGARPIRAKQPLHVVLRSSLARGPRSFLAPTRARRIENLVYRLGKKLDVRVYRFANSGNHLHLLVLPRSRESFHAFSRAFCGIVARITLVAERGRAKSVRFWDNRPFTRVVTWGRDFKGVDRYVKRNTLEAIGDLAEIPMGPKNRKIDYG
jgi:REP element-mobilizing transposase RayT